MIILKVNTQPFILKHLLTLKYKTMTNKLINILIKRIERLEDELLAEESSNAYAHEDIRQNQKTIRWQAERITSLETQLKSLGYTPLEE